MLWFAILSGHWALAEESASRVDEAFGFSVVENVAYVPAYLDREVQNDQMMDIYTPQDVERAPVVLYVHGGGWAFGDKKDVNLKPHFFASKGIAFASMNYRLRWEYKVYDQIVDVVAAVKWIEAHGADYGLDSSRIVLMGHQSGGHLVSLAVSDPDYFLAENLSTDNIRAVVSIDSVSYDIPRMMKELGSFIERRQHELIFGANEDIWAASSPFNHVEGAGDLPAFALLHDPVREVNVLQAKGFAKQLSSAGVEVIMIPGSANHPDRTDELIGNAGSLSSIALLAFLRAQM